jgi:formate C-acetyltransferase
MKYTDFFGTPMKLDGSIGGGYFCLSLGTGATPDGRLDREPCADAGVSPMAGLDKKGPTAVLRSVAKVYEGAEYMPLFNQKFTPQFMDSEENRKLFADYLKTWADSGVNHIQFNVVDKETLIDGQIHPEKHEDLMVRVAGYSAYWTYLSKGIQDDIIKRTAHTCI